MYDPVLLRDRSRPAQVILAGVLPVASGVIAGILIGISAAAYWAWGVIALLGGFLAGFEHRDGWGGADRGFFGGAFFGTAVLLTHTVTGNDPKVSLGSFPPFLAVLTAIIGMFASAAGGRIARVQRERAAAVESEEKVVPEKIVR